MNGNGTSSRGAWSGSLIVLALLALGVLTLAPGTGAAPLDQGPQAKIPEVDEDACRANLLVIADAEARYFEEYGSYTDPVGLETSGILPGATGLCCPYEGVVYTYMYSPTSYVVECPCEGHSHGRIVDGEPSW